MSNEWATERDRTFYRLLLVGAILSALLLMLLAASAAGLFGFIPPPRQNLWLFLVFGAVFAVVGIISAFGARKLRRKGARFWPTPNW